MKRMSAIVAGLLLAFVGTSATIADTIHVPADQPTIAAAISASVNGDVIAIAAGAYFEHSLNPSGKAITIQGTLNEDGTLASTIDAQQGGSVFVINTVEGNGTVIKDLVITGGSASASGGISCFFSSPTISDCTIEGNTADYGGGIYCEYSSPTISDCTIKDNSAANLGGGIFSVNSDPTISGCTIEGNEASSGGGGISCNNSNPTISDCTIEGNTADYGGGIYCQDSSPVHSGCTFSGNTPDNVYGDSDWNPLRGEGGPSMITLENCTLCGTGEHIGGNIPILHLGDNHISDCIDDGDLDGDGDVDTDDLNALHDALGINNTDVNNNGCVDIDDLLYVIEDWNEGCTP